MVLAHPDSPGKRAVKRVCVCVYTIYLYSIYIPHIDGLVFYICHLFLY